MDPKALEHDRLKTRALRSENFDQSLRYSGIALTLYGYLLVFDDEVRRQSPTSFTSSSPPNVSQRFSASGEVARRGVCSFVCAERIERLTNEPCDSLLPLHPGGSPRSVTSGIPDHDGTCHVIDSDRIVSFSLPSGSGRFTFRLARGIPRSVREKTSPPTMNHLNF